MRLTFIILSAAALLLVVPAAMGDEGQCDCSLAVKTAAQEAVQHAAADVEKLRQSCAAEAQANKQKCDLDLQKIEAQHTSKAEKAAQSVQKLQSELESTTQTLEQLRSQLADAELKAQTAESQAAKLAASESAALQHLEQLRSQVVDAEHKVKAAEGQAAKLAASKSATGASMDALRAELESARTKLIALEKAWVPVRAQNWLDQAVAAGKEQYAKLVATEQGQKVQQALLDGMDKAAALWKEFQPQVEAALTTAQAKVELTRATASELYQKHIAEAAWWKEALVKLEQVNSELQVLVKKFLQDTSPALHPYSDPVTVQFIVYVIFALPALVIAWVMAALTFGTRKPAPSSLPSRPRGPGHKRVRA